MWSVKTNGGVSCPVEKNFPFAYSTQKWSSKLDVEVEQLFRNVRRDHHTHCINPVTDGRYVAGLDPIKPQKEKARRALLAREHFRLYGPADAQPLPLSGDEIDEMACRGHLIDMGCAPICSVVAGPEI